MFLAEVIFYTGQRKFLPETGYRPDAVFAGNDDYWGITFIDLKADRFDTPILAAIEFTFQAVHYREITEGQTFKIMEGSRQVGEGKVVSVERVC